MFRTYEARDVVENFAVVSGFWDLPNAYVQKLSNKKCFVIGGVSTLDISTRVSRLKELGNNFIYILDQDDLKFVANSDNLFDNLPTVQWLQRQNATASVTFHSQSRYIATNGMIPLGERNWDKIKNNLLFAKDKEHWLKSYDGRFGYCITTDGQTEYYQYGITINTQMSVILSVDSSGVSETTIAI